MVLLYFNVHILKKLMIRHTWVNKSIKQNKNSVKYFRKRFVTDGNTPRDHRPVPEMEVQLSENMEPSTENCLTVDQSNNLSSINRTILNASSRKCSVVAFSNDGDNVQLSENMEPSTENCLTMDQSNNLSSINRTISNASSRKYSVVAFSIDGDNEPNFDLSHECTDSNDIDNTPLRYSNSKKTRVMMADQTNNSSLTNRTISRASSGRASIVKFSINDDNEHNFDLIHKFTDHNDIDSSPLRHTNSKKIKIVENCIREEHTPDERTHRFSSPDTTPGTTNEISVELEEDRGKLVQHYHPRIHQKHGGKNMVGLAWVTLAIVMVFMICHSIKWIANFYEMIMVSYEYLKTL